MINSISIKKTDFSNWMISSILEFPPSQVKSTQTLRDSPMTSNNVWLIIKLLSLDYQWIAYVAINPMSQWWGKSCNREIKEYIHKIFHNLTNLSLCICF